MERHDIIVKIVLQENSKEKIPLGRPHLRREGSMKDYVADFHSNWLRLVENRDDDDKFV